MTTLNPYDKLDNEIVDDENPYDQLQERDQQLDEFNYQSSVEQGMKQNPDTVAEAKRLSDEFKVPVDFVERNIDRFRESKKKKSFSYEEMTQNNPHIANWLKDKGNSALAHDDIDGLKGVESGGRAFKFAKSDKSMWHDIGVAAETSYMNTKKSADIFRMLYGLGDRKEIAKEIAEKNKRLQEMSATHSERFQKFNEEFAEESKQASKHWSRMVRGAEELIDGEITKGLEDFSRGAFRSADEFLDVVGLMATNPRSLLTAAAQSSMATIVPMAVGAGTGTAAGTVASGPFAPVVGVVGGALGGIAAGTMMEYAPVLESVLAENGVDINDPEQILLAFQDNDLIAEAKDQALKKGFTTAFVDRLFAIAGGKFLAKAKGGTVAAKAAGTAKAVALDATGEAVSELSGQFAQKGNLADINVAEGVMEAFVGVASGSVMDSFLVAAQLSKNQITKVRAVKKVKQEYDQANDVIQFANTAAELIEKVQETKLKDRSLESLQGLVNETNEGQPVYFQAEDWEDHWNNLGENPAEKAEELLPGGARDFETAKQDGSPIEVSMGDFVTKIAEEESFNELRQLSSNTPDGMVVKDAEFITANIDKILKNVATASLRETQKDITRQESAKAVGRDIEGQQLAAGADPRTAKYTSQLFASVMNTLGDITGKSAVEFFQQRPTEIRRATAEQIQGLRQEDGVFELTVNEEDGTIKIAHEDGILTAEQMSMSSLEEFWFDPYIEGGRITLDEIREKIKGDRVAVLEVVEVEKEERRGKGLGSSMVQKLIDIAKSNGNESIILNASPFKSERGLEDLMSFYEKLGFKPLVTFEEDQNALMYLNLEPTVLKQQDRRVTNQGFFSALERKVSDMDFKKIPPKDLVNRINKLTDLGVKPQEIEYTGIIEFLNSTTEKKVSKESVVAFLNQGGPILKTLRLGDSGVSVGDTVYGVFDEEGVGIGSFRSRDQAISYAESEGLAEENVQDMEFTGETLGDAPVLQGTTGPLGWTAEKFVVMSDRFPHDFELEVDNELDNIRHDDHSIEHYAKGYAESKGISKDEVDTDSDDFNFYVNEEVEKHVNSEDYYGALYSTENERGDEIVYSEERSSYIINGVWEDVDSLEEAKSVITAKIIEEEGIEDFSKVISSDELYIEGGNSALSDELEQRIISDVRKEELSKIRKRVENEFDEFHHEDFPFEGTEQEKQDEINESIEREIGYRARERYERSEYGPAETVAEINPIGYSIIGSELSGYRLRDKEGSEVGQIKASSIRDANKQARTMLGDMGVVAKASTLRPEQAQETGPTVDVNAGASKYGSYVVKGGTNYREVLIQLDSGTGGNKFTSGHFDEENILAHTRLNDRTGTEGEKVLFIEEIQSDWHQEGRRSGYKGKEPEALIKELPENYVIEETPEREGFQKVYSVFEVDEDGDRFKVASAFSKEEAVKQALVMVQRETAVSLVPDAPFKKSKDWALMVFKRILREAAEKGYQTIQWTSGDIQSERYDLSKKFLVVSYNPETGLFGAENVDGQIIDQQIDNENELEDLLGKDLAKKLLEQKLDSSGVHLLSGSDIKVESKGMRDFYDLILPKTIGKYVKKIDKNAKVGVGKVGDESVKGSLNIDKDFTRSEGEIDIEFTDRTMVRTIYDLIEDRFGGYSIQSDLDTLAEDADEAEITVFKNREVISSGVKDIDSAIKIIEEDLDPQEGTGPQDVWQLPITPELRASVLKGQPLFQEQEGVVRAFTDLSDPEKILIGKLKDANKSSDLHEMAHAFLEYAKIAQTSIGEAPTEAKQKLFLEDMKALSEELGVSDIGQVGVEQHEKFARLMEAYLQEGKSPSKKLARAFQSFKTWLVNIYKNIMGIEKAGGIKLNLTDDMRDIFNRLVATQDEIAEATFDMGYDSATVESFFQLLGIKDTDKSKSLERLLKKHGEAREQAEQILFKNALEQAKRKRTKLYNAKKRELKAKYQQLAKSEPVYRAINAIKTKEIDGQEIIGPKNIKMNIGVLKEMFSDIEYKEIPKSLKTTEGIHPDMVASFVGYENGRDLVNAIMNSPNEKEWVDLNTLNELSQEYPDFLDPQSETELEEEALKSVHSDRRAEALQLELQIMLEESPAQVRQVMERAIGRRPATKEVKRLAEKKIDKTTVGNMKPISFQRAENRNRREVGAALVRGDFERAANLKVKEILSHELYKLSDDARENIDKQIDKAKKRFAKSDKKLAKIGNIDMIKSAQAIMARFGMLSEAQTGRLEEHLAALKAYDPLTYQKVDGLAESLVQIQDKPMNDLTYGEFKEVMEVVDALYNLARDDKKLVAQGKKVEKEAAIEEMIERFDASGIVDEVNESKWKDGFSTWYGSQKGSMARVEHWVNFMDGGDINGPMRKYLFDPLNEAQVFRDKESIKNGQKINDIITKHFKTIFKDNRDINIAKYFDTKKGFRTAKKHELIMMMLHSGNDSNKQKLLLGRGMGSLTFDGRLDSQAYDKFISDMFEQGVLTKDDMDGIQEIWDFFEELKVESQKAHRKVYGYYFREIEANPIETPFGTYRGGYMPAVTDPAFVEAQLTRENQMELEQQTMQFAVAGVSKGFTKERVQQYNEALSLDFGLIRNHVGSVTNFYTLQPAVSNANKVLLDGKFAARMKEMDRTFRGEVLMPWLSRIATQRMAPPSDRVWLRQVERGLNFVRRNGNQQIMFGNLYNTIENHTDMTAIFIEVDAKYVAKNLGLYIHSKEMTDYISESSDFMKLRFEDQYNEINDTYSKLTQGSNELINKVEDVQKFAADHTYILQHTFQNRLDVVAWKSAYDQAIDQDLSHEDAARTADSKIRRMMGSGRIIDISDIEAGGAVRRAVLTFFSYFLTRQNVLRFTQKDKKVKAFALGLFVPAMLSEMLRKAMFGPTGEDEDDLSDDLLDVFVLSNIRYSAAMLPYGGPTLRFLEGMVSDVNYDARLSLSPALSMIEGAGSHAKLFSDSELKGRDVRNVLNFYGTLTGLPLGYFGRPIGFMIDLESGHQEASTPYRMSVGILTGRSGEK